MEASSTVPSLDPRTAVGAVSLTVGDLESACEFYEQALGLRTLERSGGTVRLGVEPGTTLVELVGDPDAPPRPRRSTGLFHLALLLPGRAQLAGALRRVARAGRSFTGAADHLVSEALYLDDPEGNGIEIYRDRPREEWRYVEGTPQMATEPLDLHGLMEEPVADAPGGMTPGTRLGHVHLQVADLVEAEAFYHGVLGLDVTVRGYPGALFLSAGGYHHHVGLNTWASRGAPPPPPGSRGLGWFELLLADPADLARISNRVDAAGLDRHDREGGLVVADLSGNHVRIES
jgi:catechol 2,3-dioxygenase